jgi:hypothetical protein
MAIAFVAASARSKADLSATGSPVSVALPTGHLSGHWLLMVVVTDDNTGPSTPAGWSLLGGFAPASSTATPYAGYPHVTLFHRIDNGSLGSSVNVSFSTAAWPTGDPYVLAWTMAYSGVDTSGPVERILGSSTVSTSAAVSHPAVTTSVANDWLLTIRASGADTAKTFGASGGTNTERVDDTGGFGAAPSAAAYDAGPLTAGAQTTRITTSSANVEYGSVAISLVIKPAAVAGSAFASPTQADASAAAFNATVSTANGPWALCGSLPDYEASIQWDPNGAYSEVTQDVISDLTTTYGRDQDRQLAPSSVGSAAFSLNNADRVYSPENDASPLAGDLDPARPMRMQVSWNGTTYPLFAGRIDDFTLKVDRDDRTLDLTFLDGLSLLQGVKLSTAVYRSMRTGELINTILDLVGWTGGRDIDDGATIVKYWWAEGTDALTAVQELVRSEGPPSVAYQAPDGTFVFRDRHHRLLRTESLASQATFTAAEVSCAAPAATGYDFTKPFTYSHGWRDIINSVSLEVNERTAAAIPTAVWQSQDSFTLSIGQSTEIIVSGSDPFLDAITPVAGTDFTLAGAGTVSVQLSRTSGAAAKITMLAVGGSVTVSNLQLRARPIQVDRTLKIERKDADSISQHGEKTYPDSAPWANANDAAAIADMVLLHYARRRPTVQIRVVTSDPGHFLQVLRRTISDRIHITHDEMRLDDDFFIERVTHTIRRINQVGKPPVHAVVLGCEKQLSVSTNPFKFDVRGAGFDQGVFDPIQADNASTVFIFDHPTQGKFDTGLFGT